MLDALAVDLSYGPDTPPQVLARKKFLIKQQLDLFLKDQKLGTIDPTKPIFYYLGRYDYSQKGIDKLPAIMTRVKELGAQMIVIGPSIDPTQTQEQKVYDDLMAISMRSRPRPNAPVGEGNLPQGLIVIADPRESKQDLRGRAPNPPFKYQGVAGDLIRAAVDLGVFPSKYEPCGLVQGEAWMFGADVCATDTGGFRDTVITKGRDQNGCLVPSLFATGQWTQAAQLDLFREKIDKAVTDIKPAIAALSAEVDLSTTPTAVQEYWERRGRIMKRAVESGWTTSPDDDKLPPVDKARLLYRHARDWARKDDKGNFIMRGKIHVPSVVPVLKA